MNICTFIAIFSQNPQNDFGICGVLWVSCSTWPGKISLNNVSVWSEIGIFSSGQVTTMLDGKEFWLWGILMTILLQFHKIPSASSSYLKVVRSKQQSWTRIWDNPGSGSVVTVTAVLTLFRAGPSAVSKVRGGAHCAPPWFLREMGGCGFKF